MLYSEIIAVCSEIRTKPINTLCGQNVAFFNVTTAVQKVTSGLPVGIICDFVDSHDGSWSA